MVATGQGEDLVFPGASALAGSDHALASATYSTDLEDNPEARLTISGGYIAGLGHGRKQAVHRDVLRMASLWCTIYQESEHLRYRRLKRGFTAADMVNLQG